MSSQTVEEILHRIAGGGAICFVGAGFSTDAVDPYGVPLPSTQQLEKEVCELISVPRDEGGSLSDLADYCGSKPELAPKLRLHLVKRLTSAKPTSQQKKLLQAPWRAVFTTNFDDVAEQCIQQNVLQIIKPQSDASTIIPGRTPLYYLHGRARDLVETDVDPLLVISETNYLELRNRNKPLHSAFLNELHCATQVVFVGYSLRDTEITSRIFEVSESLKLKSIVICHPYDSDVAQARLKKYGAVRPIGLAGFVQQFPETFEARSDKQRLANLTFVDHAKKLSASAGLERDDVDHLILSGTFSYSHFALQKAEGSAVRPYCVERTRAIEGLFKSIGQGTNKFIVSADIGNGKTTFLDQVAYHANDRAYDVFRVKNSLTETFKELEFLVTRQALQLFIIDDLPRHREAVRFLSKRLPKLGVLICGDRNVIQGDYEIDLADTLGGEYSRIDVDDLDESELKQWDNILERWGLWGGQFDVADEKRMEFLRKDCSSEVRSIVVSMFKTSRLASKINEIVNFFCKTNPIHRRAFVGMLIASLCQDHIEWSQIVDWLNIDEALLRRDLEKSAISNFVTGGRNWHQLSSAQLAHHIFSTSDIGDDVLVDVYTTIVRETAYASRDPRSGVDANQNLKELMKYRFLTKIFSRSKDSVAPIRAVYQRLSDAPKLRSNDQFWLQYAMSSIDLGKLDEAESYIDQALKIASGKGAYYSDHQILDQRARLYFLKNARSKTSPIASEIDTALRDLSKALARAGAENAIYPIRAAEPIKEFVDAKGHLVPKDAKLGIKNLLLTMREKSTAFKLLRAQRDEQKKLDQTIRLALQVLESD
jgi:tetratricopeptide (TPR) repeat protein